MNHIADKIKRILAVLLTICIMLSTMGTAVVSTVDEETGGDTPTVEAEATPIPTPVVETEAEATPTPTPTATPEVEITPTLTPTATTEAETTPTLTPTATPEAKVTPTPTSTITPEAEVTPTPAITSSISYNMLGATVLAETEEITFTAGLYSDSGKQNKVYDFGTSTYNGWPGSTSGSEIRYLSLELSNLNVDSQYRLVITMDQILYAPLNADPIASCTTVSYTPKSAKTVNTDTAYTLHDYTNYRACYDELIYTIDSSTTELGTIQLPLQFDVVLWNKEDGAILGTAANPLLTITLQQLGTDGSYSNVEGKTFVLQQATVSGEVAIAQSLSTHVNEGTYTSSVIGMDDYIKLSAGRGNSAYRGKYFNKKISVKMTVPACTVKDTEYRLNYKDINFHTTGGSSNYTLEESENGDTVTLTAENFLFTDGSIFGVTFTAPEEIRTAVGKYKFTGYLTIVLDDSITVMENRAFDITLDNSGEAELVARGVASKGINIYDLDTVQPFGNLSLKNAAASGDDSGKIGMSLKFDTENTNTAGVTAVNLVCDRVTELIEIEYVLIDKNGNYPFKNDDGTPTVFKQTIKNGKYGTTGKDNSNIYQGFTRQHLEVEEHKQYYFKELRYSIGTLTGNTDGYHSGASSANYSAGTIWGYCFVDQIPQQYPKHELEIYEQNTEGQFEYVATAQISTTIDANTSVSYGISGARVSATSIDAGESVTIFGQVLVIGYPYTSNNCLNDIRLGLKLPAGVTVNRESITAKTKSDLPVDSVEYRDIGNGEKLCIIQFEKGEKIGFYGEDVEALPNGSTMSFSVQLDTNTAMSSTVMDLTSTVFATGLNRINGSGGSYSYYSQVDTYDLNENGSATDAIAKFSDNAPSITINAQDATLEITEGLTKADEQSQLNHTLDNFADQVNYVLDIKCTNGGCATDFYYYIPIPCSKSMTMESNFVQQIDVPLILKGAASLTSSGTPIRIEYTTDEISNYEAAESKTSGWLTEEEMDTENKAWEDVTMLKLTIPAGYMENGSSNRIVVSLGYEAETEEDQLAFSSKAGQKIIWKSRGHYKYILGVNNSAATQSTNGVTVMLTYHPEETREFTLTAAKGDPIGEGATNVYSFDLPKFEMAQTYSITQVNPVNLTLVDDDYDFTNISTADANRNFRIKVSVKEYADGATSLAEVAIQKDDRKVGSLTEGKAPEFTFTLENANVLSEAVEARYVELTLIGDNGVIVPVRINIDRELTAADAAKSAILNGKQYRPFGDTSQEVEVAKNSAFTAQFITTNLNLSLYSDRKLIFENAPVDGTKVTMIDWTDPDALKYYYYEFDGSTTTVQLKNFSGMGGGSNYDDESSNTTLVKEQLLFVVQFPFGGETNASNKLWMEKTCTTQEKTEVEKSKVLSYTTAASRGFGLVSRGSNVNMGEVFTLTYSTSCGVTDSRYTGRSLALLVTAQNGAFPVDAKLQVGGKEYYLNSEGQFVVPLEAIAVVQASENNSISKKLVFSTKMTDSITISFALIASATESAEHPMMGDTMQPAITVTVTKQSEPSLRVTEMTKRLFHKDELTSGATVEYKFENVDSLQIEVRKKAGAGYATQGDVLSSVNGSTIHSSGRFIISDLDGSVDLKFNQLVESGTYRLVFIATKNDCAIEVPYNFIVTE